MRLVSLRGNDGVVMKLKMKRPAGILKRRLRQQAPSQFETEKKAK
jgi:hypothetical protein